jgi:Ca2+-binding RTX toxin-like protein
MNRTIGTATSAPVIDNIQGDTIRTWAGNTPVDIDVGGDAGIMGAAETFSYLWVFLSESHLHQGDRLGLRAIPGFEINPNFEPGSEVRVGGNLIGVMAEDASPQNLSIDFQEGKATKDIVQQLLRAITYMNASTDLALVHDAYVNIYLGDANGQNSENTTCVTVAPQDMTVLTQGKDILVGTAQDDVVHAFWTNVFYQDELDAGDGDRDTFIIGGGGEPDGSIFYLSSLGAFKGFEILRSSAGQENIFVRNDQLAGIKSFIGGGSDTDKADRLTIEGGSADLRGKTFANYSEIRLMNGDSTLTVDSKDVAMLFVGGSQHETLVVDGASLNADERLAVHRNGIDEIRILTGPDAGIYRNAVPVVSSLAGDRVKMAPGQVVHVDAGRDAVLTDDDVVMDFFAVYIYQDVDPGDLLGIDTSGRFKTPDGITEDGRIQFDGETIGILRFDAGPSRLRVDLNEKATLAVVNELARSITYTHTSGRLNRPVEIDFAFGDSGSRHTWAIVTVEPDSAVEPGNPVDPKDPVEPGKPADPVKPSEPVKAVDPIIGGKGSDSLRGGGEADKIQGGRGADKMWGGSSTDTFIFTSIKDSGTTAKKRDTIYDFSTLEGDKIDLKAIDANTRKSGDQAFSFISKKAFKHKAGELRYEKASGGIVVSGDVNGDGKADFSLALKGLKNITKSYFVL